jgi:hypothetical protein
MKPRRNERCPIHRFIFLLWPGTRPEKAQTNLVGRGACRRPSLERIPGTPVTGIDAEAAEPEDCRPGQEMSHLS